MNLDEDEGIGAHLPVYIFYNLLLLTFCLAAIPVFLFKMIFSPRRRRVFAQKLGFLPREIFASLNGKPRIWVHAVSVGEVSAIHPAYLHPVFRCWSARPRSRSVPGSGTDRAFYLDSRTGATAAAVDRQIVEKRDRPGIVDRVKS